MPSTLYDTNVFKQATFNGTAPLANTLVEVKTDGTFYDGIAFTNSGTSQRNVFALEADGTFSFTDRTGSAGRFFRMSTPGEFGWANVAALSGWTFNMGCGVNGGINLSANGVTALNVSNGVDCGFGFFNTASGAGDKFTALTYLADCVFRNNSGTEFFRMTSGGNFNIAEGGNIVCGTSTGTKIGTSTTQKIGFFNSTPIIKPTVTGSKTTGAAYTSLLTQLANLGLVIDSSTA